MKNSSKILEDKVLLLLKWKRAAHTHTHRHTHSGNTLLLIIYNAAAAVVARVCASRAYKKLWYTFIYVHDL